MHRRTLAAVLSLSLLVAGSPLIGLALLGGGSSTPAQDVVVVRDTAITEADVPLAYRSRDGAGKLPCDEFTPSSPDS